MAGKEHSNGGKTTAEPRVGVILFNLGGPETLDDVQPFLYKLFSDPETIRLPIPALNKPLAWLISTTRQKKSKHYYELIGGGSPLRRITTEQAKALEKELSTNFLSKVPVKVYVGMRFWHPLTEAAVSEIVNDGITHLVALPLYPQFSVATTGSSIKAMIRAFEASGGQRAIRRHYITHWFEDHEYISATAEQIKKEINGFSDQTIDNIHILFSAHSIPLSYVNNGDPYERQTKRTIEMVMREIGRPFPYHLSFQSRVGPAKWLGPNTDETIRRLAGEGVKQLAIVPISFVSEHVETLYELDILYRDVANEVGIKEMRRVPTLNTEPQFIRGLAAMVKDKLARWSPEVINM
ncbi:MAG TPA: ferrochelatase [Blastocatellia bacterium]|nr:ferrochelatase [Blastocatellia bacterium]